MKKTKAKQMKSNAAKRAIWASSQLKNDLFDFFLTLIPAFWSVIGAIEEWIEAIENSTTSKTVQNLQWVKIALFGVSFFAFTWIAWKKLRNLLNRKKLLSHDYQKALIVERIDKAVFASLCDANGTKIRSTLRFTYGNIHDWNPINYRKNVLVYDVHEHLRTILLNLKNVIIQTDKDRFHDDNVTIDLVWCYPKENGYNGYLPYNETCPEGDRSKFPWKLISTGDRSASAHSIQEWLKSKDSFYAAVIQKGYSCCNKNEISGQYHADTKDKEYNEDMDHMAGSIAGVVIDVKNDEPSRVLVRAVLTVNTFGENFYDEASCNGLSREEYEEILKQRIIIVYKSLLASEMVQMYLRHSIREDGRCPITGSLPEERKQTESKKCSPDKCSPKECESLSEELESFSGKRTEEK